MRILLSNDDGYYAPGIECLSRALSAVAEIIVVAPERDRSGASNSLTLDRPLALKQSVNGFYYVNGTPADCVHLALTGMLDALPDMVVSGINNGANMGDDTIYSGTVAAATEAYLRGVPSVAVSLCGKPGAHYETAARVALDVVRIVRQNQGGEPVLLNVNVPDIPFEALRGRAVTRLGRRHTAESVVPMETPRGETAYWVGAAGAVRDAGEGTDFYAVADNWVSITPLRADLTHTAQLDRVRSWL